MANDIDGKFTSTTNSKWKIKFTNLIHSNTFCGICLENDQNMWKFCDFINISGFGYSCDLSLEQILNNIFINETITNLLVSENVCNRCAERAITAYQFVQNVRKSSNILSKCLQYLDFNMNNAVNLIENIQNCDESVLCFNLKDILSEQRNEIIIKCQGETPQLNKELNSKRKIEEEKFIKEESREMKFSCLYCGKNFPSWQSLKVHKFRIHKIRKKQPNPMSCSMCMENFIRFEDYLNHISTHPPDAKHICRICKLTFNSKFNYDIHYRGHKLKEKTCSKNVNSNNLESHIQTHTKVNNIKQNFNRKKNHMCDICGKFYITDIMLLRHKEIHNDQVQCQICNNYVTKSSIKQHFKTHFQGRSVLKELSCSICDYKTRYPNNLEAHKNHIHFKIRPYKCKMPECGKDFYARNKLNDHMKRHSDIKHYGKYCDICDYFFYNTQSLQQHKRIHTGERPYSCDKCGECFISSSRLKEHKDKHHTTPNVPCPICKKKYYTVRYLRAHVKKSHCKGLKGKDFKNITHIEGLSNEDFEYIFNRKL